MDEPEDPAIEVGYVPIRLHVKTFQSDFSLLPDELPTGKLSPVPFIEGFRASLEEIMAAVELKYHMNACAVLQWREFLQAAPQNDNVEDYIANHPMHIPLAQALFGINENGDFTPPAAAAATSRSRERPHREMETWMSQPSARVGLSSYADEPYIRVEPRTRLPVPGDEDPVFQSYYVEAGEEPEDSSQDEADMPSRWCTVRRETKVHRYGDAKRYVGRMFQRTHKKYRRSDYRWAKGRIVSVVRNKDILNGELHFKFYSPVEFPDSIPTNESDYGYERCALVMSTAKSNGFRLVCEQPRVSQSSTGRRRRGYVYLDEDNNDVTNEVLIAKRQRANDDDDGEYPENPEISSQRNVDESNHQLTRRQHPRLSEKESIDEEDTTPKKRRVTAVNGNGNGSREWEDVIHDTDTDNEVNHLSDFTRPDQTKKRLTLNKSRALLNNSIPKSSSVSRPARRPLSPPPSPPSPSSQQPQRQCLISNRARRNTRGMKLSKAAQRTARARELIKNFSKDSDPEA